jgi:hypothetical protein
MEDFGDDCIVKMRSQGGLVVSPACDRLQPLAPVATAHAWGLNGRTCLPPSIGDLRDGDDGPLLVELCFIKPPLRPATPGPRP